MVHVLRSLVRGPLEPHVAGFAAELARLGYSRSGAEQHVCFVAHLDRWMMAGGLDLAALDDAVLAEYLAGRRAAGYAQYCSPKALRPLLDYLRPLGVLPPPEAVALSPVESMLSDYQGFLLAERGLTAGTARGYCDAVRPFVTSRLHDGVVEVAGITAAEVNAFVLSACPGRAVGSAKLIVTALRSLLRWLHLTGRTGAGLAEGVPSVAGARLSGLPSGLEPAQLRRLLAACDRRTVTGCRDYAVLLVLARLGLRAGEVAGLGLDDIDWRAGELVVVGKGRRSERLPLPAEVGAAVTAYLQRGRPATALNRSVFVRVRAPHRALSTGGITEIVFDASVRAGLPPMHAHRLRHTAATMMLRGGSSLTEVGQVLRHRSPLTTAIYAKVDRDSLAALARPWPTFDAPPATTPQTATTAATAMLTKAAGS